MKIKNNKLAKILPFLPTILILVVFFFPGTAHAASVLQNNASAFGKSIGFGNADIRTIIASLIKTFLSLLGIILVVMFVWGGFLWMTSGGDDDRRSKAKSTIFNAIIGLIIILMANSIVIYVVGTLTSAVKASGN